MKTKGKAIVIDGREFAAPKITGIGRILIGLLVAIDQYFIEKTPVLLCVPEGGRLPKPLGSCNHLATATLPAGSLASEIAISRIAYQRGRIFISPYPKLPIIGCGCPCINMVPDVHDITFKAYASRPKRLIDEMRLRIALRRSDLTWYISHDSLRNTKALAGKTGKNPRVHHLGIGDSFSAEAGNRDEGVLEEAGLRPGYIVVVGNGMPHKNLGILLSIWDRLDRPLVFVGVSCANRDRWEKEYPLAQVSWIEKISDEALPVLYRNAFCLAQPSFAEGYGYPPLEAMACGIPAVVSDIPVLRETTGENALFADPGNPSQWTDSFERLEDKTFYQRLQQKGVRWVAPLIGSAAWRGHIEDIHWLLNH